ncbi:uncharacterized protein LOC110845681 [Folsomia candida]|nr:uncharacterized protein LOC110845681 [Folsomia candida]
MGNIKSRFSKRPNVDAPRRNVNAGSPRVETNVEAAPSSAKAPSPSVKGPSTSVEAPSTSVEGPSLRAKAPLPVPRIGDWPLSPEDQKLLRDYLDSLPTTYHFVDSRPSTSYERYCKEQGTGDNSVDPRSPTSEYNRTPVPSGEGDASTGDEEEPSECADQLRQTMWISCFVILVYEEH